MRLPSTSLLGHAIPACLARLALVACFALPLAAQATMVRLYTTTGPIDIALKDDAAPTSVANFLAYVQSTAYDGTFIHRNVPGFVVQGGGYKLTSTGSAPHIPTRPPIALEYNAARPNIRGSISMARTSELNSATSEWFLNLVDNTTTLGPTNAGGYAVFGQMTTPSLVWMDAISRLPTINAGGTFSTLPLATPVVGSTIKDENLVLINSAVVLPAQPSASDRAFNYLEVVYADYLKPPGTVSAVGTANNVTYYFRYYPKSSSYVGVGLADNVIYYIVPSVNDLVNRFAPLAEIVPEAAQAGY